MVKDGRFRALPGLPNATRRLPPPLKDRGPKPGRNLAEGGRLPSREGESKYEIKREVRASYRKGRWHRMVVSTYTRIDSRKNTSKQYDREPSTHFGASGMTCNKGAGPIASCPMKGRS